VAFGNRDSVKGGALWFAQSGTVTISGVAEDRVTGTLDVTFKDGHLTGWFAAAGCDDWARGTNSIP
jgi:hypothetical protein